MDSGVIIMLIALFVMITSVFIVLMLMLPEWFGISKKSAPDQSTEGSSSPESKSLNQTHDL